MIPPWNLGPWRLARAGFTQAQLLQVQPALVTQVPSHLHTHPQAVSLPPPTRELFPSPFVLTLKEATAPPGGRPGSIFSPIHRSPRDCAKALFPHATDSSHTQKYAHEHTHTRLETQAGLSCHSLIQNTSVQQPRGLLVALTELRWLSEASLWRSHYWGGDSWGPASVIMSLYCRLKKPSLYNPTVMRARSTSPPMELPTMRGRGL